MPEVRITAVPNFGATVALGVFFLVANVASGLYAARDVQPSAAFGLLYLLGMTGVVTYWIHADCRRLGIREPLDLGWFVLIAWPVSFPYHLVKTRGPKGLLTFLGLAVLVLLTYALGFFVYYLARPAGGVE